MSQWPGPVIVGSMHWWSLGRQKYVSDLFSTEKYLNFSKYSTKHVLWVLIRRATLLMSTHNICFYGDIRKLLTEYTRLSGAMMHWWSLSIQWKPRHQYVQFAVTYFSIQQTTLYQYTNFGLPMPYAWQGVDFLQSMSKWLISVTARLSWVVGCMQYQRLRSLQTCGCRGMILTHEIWPGVNFNNSRSQWPSFVAGDLRVHAIND